MYDGFKGLVVRLLRVPPEPEPPTGEQLEVFRAARRWFDYRRIVWLLGTLLFVPIVLIAAGGLSLAAYEAGGGVAVLLYGFAGVLAALFIAVSALRYATLRLDYEMRWYMVTDRSLRIREGVILLREMTLTFANIQEISIQQGPIQRIFGVRDVLVRTAGGGTPSQKSGLVDMHVAHFRGVDNAEAIRDLVRARLEAYKDAGLGDEDDVPTDASDLVGALEALRVETRALRGAFRGPVES